MLGIFAIGTRAYARDRAQERGRLGTGTPLYLTYVSKAILTSLMALSLPRNFDTLLQVPTEIYTVSWSGYTGSCWTLQFPLVSPSIAPVFTCATVLLTGG